MTETYVDGDDVEGVKSFCCLDAGCVV